MTTHTCPFCGSPATKAMYLGIPLKLCGDTETCGGCWGFWDFLMPVAMLFNVGDAWVFIRYERYWPCLWAFLSGETNRKMHD